ncbi:MAG: prephenate dehydrogenase [Planctomycetota bacterium]|jgi:prephenate dehydrogenase
MKSDVPRRITVIGLGLMGGSLALAARANCPGVRVRGVDFPGELARARARGAVEGGSPPWRLEAELDRADLVVLAAPIRAILALIGRVARALPPGATLTDLGSTKAEICELAEQLVPPGRTFIGGHPFCGSEKSGIGAADPALYRGAPFALTPIGDPGPALRELGRFIRRLGAVVRIMSPEDHDRRAALISHVPRLLAVALTLQAGKEGNGLDLAAGGFRDLTRGASSNPEMWADILSTNAAPIGESLDGILEGLAGMRERLGRGECEALTSRFREARRIRGEVFKG